MSDPEKAERLRQNPKLRQLFPGREEVNKSKNKTLLLKRNRLVIIVINDYYILIDEA